MLGLWTLLHLVPAHAGSGPWHVDALLRTDVPTLAGITAQLESPARIRAALTLGTFPGLYLDGIQAVATSAGWYDQATAALIDASLRGSLGVHPEVGLRPLPGQGWYLDGGYQLVTLGGSLTSTEALEALTGRSAGARGGALELQARSTLHLITIGTGWTWTPARRWIVASGIGGAFTAAASTRITVPGQPARFPQIEDTASLGALAAEGEEILDEIFRHYVHTPYVSVSVGYRLR
ncbi:MAG TPA: hypothetical protein ENK18_23095 [Deltaproteobacteria bacterium]|nr:hypothetical protein [Deltaproteobacteria bacterium]